MKGKKLGTVILTILFIVAAMLAIILYNDLQASGNKIATLKAAAEETQLQITELETEIETLEAEAKEAKNTIKDLEGQVKDLTAAAETAAADAETALNDTVAAAEATAQGLETCILGWLDDEKIRKICGLDGAVRLVITLGYAYPDYKLREKTRKPLDELVSFKD